MSTTTDLRSPQTAGEWQFAADLAHTYLLFDSARKYGLISGGPEIDPDRCEEIIQRAAEQGVSVSPDAVEWCTPIILARHGEET